jgi:hypothetical protein
MTEFVRGDAHEEAGNCPMYEKCQHKTEPLLLRPEEINHSPGNSEQGEMTSRLKPALCVAAFREFTESGMVNAAAIPVNPERFSDFIQRWVAHIISSSKTSNFEFGIVN